jgi:gliding motility-associated-like protein
LPTGGTNFHSFADAVAYMQNGLNGPITFNVTAGTGPYNEQILLDSKIGTTATNTLTFNCNGVTLSFTSNNTLSRAGVKLDNISYVTFNKIRITPQAAGQFGYGFHLLNNSDNNVIKNCRIILPTKPATPGNNEGIVINGDHGAATTTNPSNCDNNLIQNDTISGGRTGITLNSAPGVLMLGNKILNNFISNSYTSCIQLNYNDGTLVDGNDLQGGPNAITKVSGVYLNLFDQNVKVTNNKIHNFHVASTGSLIHGILNSALGAAGKENLFANNLIYDFSSDYNQYGIAAKFATTSYFNIYNNTISLDDQNQYAAECRGIYLSDASNVNVFNNIVTITTLTSDFNLAITLEKWMPGLAFKRNVFYVTGCDNPDGQGVGLLGNQLLKLLSDWQKVTGLDYSSVYIDPQYTNLAAFNFVPKAQPIDNMALYENINTDITGAARSTTNPDPGCYEFVTAACQPGVVAGGTTVLPDSILCYGPQITLGLTGNNWGVGQTYTFQSATSAAGTYTDISTPLAYPSFDLLPGTTYYYRAAVTCLGNTKYSAPIRVIINTRLTAGTYTINSAQPTGGINFNSFGDAILAMQCGITGSVVFNVAPGSGPYNEQVIIPAVATSPTQTVTFKGNGATVSYAVPSTSTEKAVIKLNGIDYVTIDSLNIKVMGASSGYGIQLMGDADHNTIKRCTVSMSTTATATGFAGIVLNNSLNDPADYNTISYCDSNTITNNTITGGYYGITCTSKTVGATALPLGNIISGNTIVDSHGSGIYLDGTAQTLVDSNDISQQARTSFTSFSGIYLKQTNTSLLTPNGNQISRNRVHDLMNKGVMAATTEADGIHIEGVDGMSGAPNIVSNNILYNFRGIAPQYGILSKSSNYVKIYHNTISLEDSTGTTNAGILTAGIGFLGNLTTGAEVKNNSVVIKRGGQGTRTGIYLSGNDNNLKADYNNYFITGATGVNYTGSMGGKNYAQLTDWLAVKKDSNSISLYPLYKDSLKADFTPTLIPFDDKGTYVGVTNDISNNIRSTSKPDIGANEFTICYPLTEPVVTVDSLGGFVIKFAWTAVENARGYRVSRDGINWTDPSSGPKGTTHYIYGLTGQDTVGLMVEALGTRWDCPSVFSQRVVGKTLSDQIFFPNTFTPNNNGQNDKFKLYSNVVQTMRLIIFNQWGEKVFETNDIRGEWDGYYKGKPQPIGVYVYAASLVLTDGTNVVKKGSFNLLR